MHTDLNGLFMVSKRNTCGAVFHVGWKWDGNLDGLPGVPRARPSSRGEHNCPTNQALLLVTWDLLNK